MSYHPDNDFGQQLWANNIERRYELSGDLIDSNLLTGKTKKEVRQIPGDENNRDESDSRTCYLAIRTGFTNIDPDVPDVEFKNGRLSR